MRSAIALSLVGSSAALPFGSVFNNLLGREAEPEPVKINKPYYSHRPYGGGTSGGFPGATGTGTGIPLSTGTAGFSMLSVDPIPTPVQSLSVSYGLAPTSVMDSIPSVAGAESLPPLSVATEPVPPPASQPPGESPSGSPGTELPGFPTGFPSGFPTGLPSGFPTAFPTGFPTGFPTASGSYPFPTTFGTVVRGPIPTPPPVPEDGSNEETWKSWWQQWADWLRKWASWGQSQNGQNDQ